jgi:hypothetical protein
MTFGNHLAAKVYQKTFKKKQLKNSSGKYA